MIQRYARKPRKDMEFFDREDVIVDDFDFPGRILDLGGGGEGVIGRLKGDRVVSIDVSKRLLEHAPEGPLKILMDATDLKFLDRTFGVVTAFYTLMYIEGAAKQRAVFAEAYRVLMRDGRFLIWDAVVPPCCDPEKQIATFLVNVKLPGEEIRAGYGMRWPADGCGCAQYEAYARDAGFEIMGSCEEGCRLTLELRKP